MYTIPHDNFKLVKDIDDVWILIENFDEKEDNPYIDQRDVQAGQVLCQTSKAKKEIKSWYWHASKIVFTCGYTIEDF